MISPDKAYIGLVLKSEDSSWQDLGVSTDMIDSSVRPVYAFIVQHYGKYGKAPSRREVKRHFPAFRFLKTTEPIAYYAEQLINNYRATKLRNLLTDTSEAYNADDVATALDVFAAGASDILKTHTTMKPMEYSDAIQDAYEDYKANKGLDAEYSFGSALLDADLLGMERGDWCLLAGAPAAGKTWLLLKLLYTLWAKEELNVLLISMELGTPLIKRRLNSIAARVNYTRYRRGMLDDDEKMRLRRAGDKKRNSWFNVVSAANHNRSEGKFGSTDSMALKIQQYKPDIFAVDGLYLAMNMESWGETAAFANDFHSMLQSMGIPGMATTQLKNIADTSKPRLSDLAFTAAFQQATDFVLMIGKDDKMRAEKEAVVTVAKARESEDCIGYFMDFDPGAKIRLKRMGTTLVNPLMADEAANGQASD